VTAINRKKKKNNNHRRLLSFHPGLISTQTEITSWSITSKLNHNFVLFILHALSILRFEIELHLCQKIFWRKIVQYFPFDISYLFISTKCTVRWGDFVNGWRLWRSKCVSNGWQYPTSGRQTELIRLTFKCIYKYIYERWKFRMYINFGQNGMRCKIIEIKYSNLVYLISNK
jgi:hypothetical protein